MATINPEPTAPPATPPVPAAAVSAPVSAPLPAPAIGAGVAASGAAPAAAAATAAAIEAWGASLSWSILIFVLVTLIFIGLTFAVFSVGNLTEIAKNFGKLPEWHQGFGGDAFIFIDEITIK